MPAEPPGTVLIDGVVHAVTYKTRRKPGHAMSRIATIHLGISPGVIVTSAYGRSYTSALDNAVVEFRKRQREA